MDTIKTLVIGFLVFAPLEALFALHPRRIPRKRWIAEIGLTLFNNFLMVLPLNILIAGGVIATQNVIPAFARDAISGLSLWLQIPLLVLIWDFFTYVGHRAFHTKHLWKYHAIHHSAEELDWLVAFRNHPVENLVMKTLAIVPVVALGFSDAAIATFAMLYLWQTWFVHSNIRVKFGPLRYVIVGPEFHHWHHANEPAAYNKNFAGSLPIWDIVFGTVHLPKDRMPEAYGIDTPIKKDFLGLLAHPFRGWFKLARAKTSPPVRT